jgi:hypothetical protein
VPLRLLARAAPFVLGAVAAAVWLRRRNAPRPALPVRSGAAPPNPAAPRRPRSGRFDRPSSGRFARAYERRPVDIVTVVDDLLGASS